ncbi:hypothetical protein CEUSTIGMA_g12863.t1 [Chlamydomonas eustigma]|uniref:Uncharacterized protein n=1 Tax=Chlamydomonas eustigma TaxID=1157962 RepID=A0A250XQV3_9CHLO|nr:hypothetical protein CEUSTIGMA_g12863.t1 [Chlamydomonas eustigma]|eukprot:GAX85447.1 hypothetical protein CEUSTIGMA_g12863.t1 [Chlamydomonas eustigma]
MEENEAPHSEGMGRGVMTGGGMEMDQPAVSLLQHADSVVRVAARKAQRPSQAAVSTVNSCIDENNGPAVGMLLAGEGDDNDDDLEEAEVDSAEQPQVSGASNTLPASGAVDLEVAREVEGPVLSLLSVQGEGGSGASHHHRIVASQPALSQSCSCMEENEAPHSEGMGRGVMTGGGMEMDQPAVSLLQHADSVVRVAARKAERPSWAAVSTVNSCIDENNGPAVGMLLAGEGDDDDDDLEEAEVDSAEQPQVSGASNTLPAGGVVDLEVAREVCVPLVMSSHGDKTKVAGPSFVGEVASKSKARGRTNNKGRLSMSGQSGHRGN